MCRTARNSSNCRVQRCSLYVERSLGLACACKEDWMIIFYTDPPTACLQTASVDPLIAVFSVLCLARGSIATIRTCCVGHVWEYLLLLQPRDKTTATEGEDLVSTETPSLTMLAVLLLCFFPCLTQGTLLCEDFFIPNVFIAEGFLKTLALPRLGLGHGFT